jgi:hypothetical protein
MSRTAAQTVTQVEAPYELWWRHNDGSAAVHIIRLMEVGHAREAILRWGSHAYEFTGQARVADGQGRIEWRRVARVHLETEGFYVVSDAEGNEHDWLAVKAPGVLAQAAPQV